MSTLKPYDVAVLPAGVRSRFLDNGNGLTMHLLEAGYQSRGRPCVLLLHGFPELAYSWRKVMLPLAEAGYHVIAPDQRGYGRTIGWDENFDGDLRKFSMQNLVTDALGLVNALGYRNITAVFGHDFGSFVAGWCALIRPDVFRSVVMMSAPFAGPPSLPFATDHPDSPKVKETAPDIHAELAKLPRPRKHYQWYYSTREANANMQHCPQGVHAFLRAYYHHKSADWQGNQPFPLKGWTAEELAKLPTYYVMDLDKGMAETVASEMPSASHIAACRWLPEQDLHVYSAEYERVGFQGGLQWYRCMTSPQFIDVLKLYSGRTIDIPSAFIAGANDWGIHQKAGNLHAMQHVACTRMLDCDLVPNAGHWVQQEQPEKVSELLLRFLQHRAPKN